MLIIEPLTMLHYKVQHTSEQMQIIFHLSKLMMTVLMLVKKLKISAKDLVVYSQIKNVLKELLRWLYKARFNTDTYFFAQPKRLKWANKH